MSWKVYHNNRCTKSRNALSYLEDKGIDFDVVEYMKEPIDKNELKEVILLLGIKPEDLIRKNEQEYKDHFKTKKLSDDEWIEAMITYPKLMQRPIVVHDKKALIARPTEEIDKLL